MRKLQREIAENKAQLTNSDKNKTQRKELRDSLLIRK
ncbi:XyeA family cyclophane-containing RiPP triceptide [Xenorhabdus griffiniae]